MKKKHREITVNGISYAWSVRAVDHEDGSSLVILWKDKKEIGKVSLKEEDITPSQIEKIIKEKFDSHQNAS